MVDFKRGDLVVYELGYKFVMEVDRHRKNNKVLVRKKTNEKNFNAYYLPFAKLRHATPEEIEKGYRIDNVLVEVK